MLNVEDVLAAVQRAAVTRTLICIDGPAGAGKTTLAARVASVLPDSFIVHMDDLYKGWQSPLSSDLFQRVVDDITRPFLAGQVLTYATWNWTAGAWNESTRRPSPQHLIVEGVGACARQLRAQATLSIYVDFDDKRGIERVNARDGMVSEPHMSQWLTHQRAHFASDNTRSECDLVVRSSE